MQTVFRNFRIVDEGSDFRGSLVVQDGRILEILDDNSVPSPLIRRRCAEADQVLDGSRFTARSPDLRRGKGDPSRVPVLMPAFVDLHAHFRDPGLYGEGAEPRFLAEPRFPAETLESACLAAAAGGFGTVVCMANTKPAADTIDQARRLRRRSCSLGIIDLYPALSLTVGMEGKELSEITRLPGFSENAGEAPFIRLFSEDGKDLAGDGIFLAALAEARRTGVTLSCHCDLGGEDAAVERVLKLARRAAAPVHIAHVSTGKAAALIRQEKARFRGEGGFRLSCEVTPHHLALTGEDAATLGAETFGRVYPPLRGEDDRCSLAAAVLDGTVDAIATDHAPHTEADKAGGAPGFTGLETAFAVCYSALALPDRISLSKLSSLMSAAPARILGLDQGSEGRGRIAPGLRADLCIASLDTEWTVDPQSFMSRGKNSPFAGKSLRGKITAMIRGGRILFDRMA
ncbi:MAG: amidohydrolase family protein [Treponema sp.]|jgi:dihydroorotase|nr:amidohydrolase family protein [Treponema sp.]